MGLDDAAGASRASAAAGRASRGGLTRLIGQSRLLIVAGCMHRGRRADRRSASASPDEYWRFLPGIAVDFVPRRHGRDVRGDARYETTARRARRDGARAQDEAARRGARAEARDRSAAGVARVARPPALPVQHAQLDCGARPRRPGGRRAGGRAAGVDSRARRSTADSTPLVRLDEELAVVRELPRDRARAVRRSSALHDRVAGRPLGRARPAALAADDRREQREVRRLAAPRRRVHRRPGDRGRRPRRDHRGGRRPGVRRVPDDRGPRPRSRPVAPGDDLRRAAAA